MAPRFVFAAFSVALAIAVICAVVTTVKYIPAYVPGPRPCGSADLAGLDRGQASAQFSLWETQFDAALTAVAALCRNRSLTFKA
jgi:hypothetical protein